MASPVEPGPGMIPSLHGSPNSFGGLPNSRSRGRSSRESKWLVSVEPQHRLGDGA